MKRKLSFIICLLFLLPVIHAQTAAELEAALESPAITCAQAASFIIRSVDPEFAENAYDLALSRGWFKNERPDDHVTMGRLSFMFMQAYDIKGGFMYSLFPGKRYAFRTMVSRSLIQGDSDPALTVAGDNFLLILGRVLSGQGGDL